jgi:predicted dehydrogenase
VSQTIRWGILATGGIAAQFAEALNSTQGCELVAVASRAQSSADEFGKRWNVPVRYDNYRSLCADPNVDVVYVATPHHLHYELALAAIAEGKHVLCEKPFTLNRHQTHEVFSAAAQRQLLVVEAVWMRFIPAIVALRQAIADGLIGDIRLITADFCFDLPFDPTHRLYDRSVGGGALLDLGIYPLSFATMLLGIPDEVQSMTVLGDSGVDETDVMQLGWAGGARAQLSCSLRMHRPMEARISGSTGWIHVPRFFIAPDRFVVHRSSTNTESKPEAEPQVHSYPLTGNGLPHEIVAFNDAVRRGLTELPQQTTAETLSLMGLMDRLRSDWGLTYASEEPNATKGH